MKISGEQAGTPATRDRGLLKHSAVTSGYWLRETDYPARARRVMAAKRLLA